MAQVFIHFRKAKESGARLEDEVERFLQTYGVQK